MLSPFLFKNSHSNTQFFLKFVQNQSVKLFSSYCRGAVTLFLSTFLTFISFCFSIVKLTFHSILDILYKHIHQYYLSILSHVLYKLLESFWMFLSQSVICSAKMLCFLVCSLRTLYTKLSVFFYHGSEKI